MAQKQTMTIGKLATEALKAGKSSKETLELVHRVFPEAQTRMASIYWYAKEAGVKLGKQSVVDQSELAKVLKDLRKAS